MAIHSSTGSHQKVPLVEFWKGIGIWGYGALFLLIGIHLYVFLFLPLGHFSQAESDATTISKPSFQLLYALGTETKVIDERALLWDSSPLYLPTKHNYSQTITRFQKHFYGNELLMMYTPHIGIMEQFKQQMPLAIYCKPLEVKDLLGSVGEDVFKSMGQEPLAVDPLRPRLAQVCIRDFATQQLVYCQDITNIEGVAAEVNMWEYAAFTLDVANVGKNVPALMLHSSGQEALDQAFQRYIREDLQVNQLVYGYYEVDFTP